MGPGLRGAAGDLSGDGEPARCANCGAALGGPFCGLAPMLAIAAIVLRHLLTA